MSNPKAEELLFPPKDNWNYSLESILNQKITKISKSESLFDFPDKFGLSFSEVELRQLNLKNMKEKTPKWELFSDKVRFPRMIRTKSQMRDELEILKINMPPDEKAVELRDSQVKQNYETEAKKKKTKRLMKILSDRPPVFVQKFRHSKTRDLLSEIEGSESAKTDTVIWKFLKRGPTLRREYVNSRKLMLQIQGLRFPDLCWIAQSRFQNTQPTKVTCPNCRFFVTTHIKKVSTIGTKLTSIVLAILGLCVVPHAFYAFRDTVHICPLCKIYLGFCPAFNIRFKKKPLKSLEFGTRKCQEPETQNFENEKKMVSASSTSAKNLFVESKLRLCDRVQVNVNNIAAITRQIQRGSKSSENLIAAAKNFALQEAAIENSETNLKKLRLLTTHIHNQLDSLNNSSSNVELVLEQVRSMQR